MKKLLLAFCAVIAVAVTVAPPSAQAQVQQTTSAPLLNQNNSHALIPTKDTVTNGGIGLMKVKIPGFQNMVSIEAGVRNISGTLGGKMYLYASNSDDNIYRIPSISQTTGALVLDSAVMSQTGGVFGHIFVLHNHDYQYYYIRYVGAGTMVTEFFANAIWRRQP